jgi:hypothetical protein
MAVAFVSAVSGTNFSGAGTTVTCSSVTVGSGQTFVVVFSWRRNAAQALSSVTFNGSPSGLTAITGASLQTGPGDAEIGAYIGVGLSGTADVVVTLDANSGVMAARTFVLSGVDTGTPYGTVVSSTGNDNPSDTATGTTDGLGIDAFVLRNSDTMTEGAGQSNAVTLGTGVEGTIQCSSTKAGEVSLTMEWTGNTSGDAYAHILIPLLAAAGGTTIAPGLGSVPMTGRAPTIGWTIGMPDQA